MLQSSRRLTTALFTEVMLKGRVFHSTLFTLRATKSDGISRFSVAIPKKVAKTAVERNKLRRRAYSALRTVYPQVLPGFHGVLIAKSQLLDAKFAEIAPSLQEFFVKSGLLK